VTTRLEAVFVAPFIGPGQRTMNGRLTAGLSHFSIAGRVGGSDPPPDSAIAASELVGSTEHGRPPLGSQVKPGFIREIVEMIIPATI